MIKTLLLTLALLVAFPAAAQVPFDDLPEQTTLDPTNQILVVDTTLADPLQQQRRMMLRRALDWVTANPAGTATDTLATLGIGGTVYNFAGGGGTADGVLTDGSVSGDTATFTRSIGADVDVSGFFSASNLIAGSGITLTPGAGNNRTIVANSQPFALYEEGIELTSNLHGINFRGFEVVVLDTPQGIANIRFGSILQDEGTELSEDGSHIVNYTGAGITSSFNNTTKALTVNVPGGTTLTAAATSGLLISGNAISFSPSRLSRFGAAEPAARSDDLVLKNESDANSPGLISVHNFLEGIAGNNLSVDGNNRQLNAEAADGVLDLLNVSTTGARQLNLTLGRSEGLAALTDTVQLPIATWAVANDALATGTAPPARLGTGTRNSTTFLRGDGVYAAAGGGGTVDGVVSTAHLSTTGARQLDLTLERTNGLSDLQTGINLPIATWAVEDNADVVGTAEPFRLGTGTRDGTRFLKDDGVWSPIPVAAMPDWVDLPETPSTITADGCVAGNAAGDALEFVTCGSGGGGTDVVANPGGSPSDDLTTVTIAGTDYSIVADSGTVSVFRTSLKDLTRGTLQSTWEQILDWDAANHVINYGGFIRYSDSTGRERVEIPPGGGGLYLVATSISVASNLNNTRYTAQVRFTIERGGVETEQPEIASCYDRGSNTSDAAAVSTCTVAHAVIYNLQAGDRIGVQDRTQDSARQHSIVGAESFVQIWRLMEAASGGAVVAWAEDGNTDLIPSGKLGSSVGTGEFLYRDQTGPFWRSIVGASGGAQGDQVLVMDNSIVSAIDGGSTGQVFTRTNNSFAMSDPTLTGLTDTPATITADECLAGDAAGTALVFQTCGTGGGGTGDITAVNTPTNSGMLGGETTGDVTLGLDVSNLAGYTSTVSAIDHIAVSDESETDDPTRRLTLSELATFAAAQANGGIASTLGQFHIQSNELPIATAVADADRVVGWDQSAFSTRAFEASTLRDYVTDGLVEVEANPGGAPAAELSTITIDGTDYSIEGGGGGGTDAVFEHTTIATHTQTTNIGNTDALAVTLDRNPAAGTLLKVVIVTTSESGGGTDTSYASTYLDSDDYLALTEITALPNGNQTETDTALNVPFVGANDSALPTVSRALTLNRGSGTTIYVRINGFFARYEPFVLTVEELSIDGGGGGGGSTTFTALTDTPAAITADECVAGNSAGDALEFVTCGAGGGGGDITAVLTATDSGLTGGTTSGSADLAIADGGITNVRIATDAVTRAKIGEAAVGTLEIASGGVGNSDLANDSVTNAKIANSAIGQHKIATGGVSNNNLSSGSVSTVKIAAQAVTGVKIEADVHLDGNPTTTTQADSDDSTRIATTAFVQANSGGGGGGDITAVLTGSGSGLTGGTTSGSANLAIGNLAVTTPRLASNAVTTNKIASGAVGTTDLANRAVTGGKIASSVSLAGNPTTTTQADSDDSTRIATTAFVQSVSGGGTGDITAVTTASGSGLAGGVLTGAADLSLSLNGMGSGGALEGRDEFPFDDKSDATQRTFLTSFENHAVWLAGATDGGIGVGTEGLVMDIDDLVTISTISEDDHMAIADDTIASRDTRRTTVGSFVSGTAGYGIRNDGEGNYRLDFDGLGASQGIDPSEDKMVIWNESETGVHPNLIDMNTYFLSVTDQNVFGFDDSVAGDGLEIRDGGIGAELLEDDILNQLTTAAAVDPDADFVAFVDRSAGDTKKVQVADLFDSAMGNQFARDSDGEVIIAANGITNYAIANSAITQQKIAANAVRTTEINNNAITQAKMADNSVGPAEMDPESATVGQVMMIGSGGAPTWSHPFEFPRTSNGRAISTNQDMALLTSTIQVATGNTVNVSVTITVTQSGTGSCAVQFYQFRSATPFGFTTITDTAETETVTITTTSASIGANASGSAFPITLYLNESGIGTGESCVIDAGDATLALTIP